MAPPAMNRATTDVLGLLFQAWEQQTEVHGWQLMRSLRRSGPTVYAVLDRLEDAGWVTGSWERPADRADGRPRRRYRDAGQCSALQGGGEGPRGRAAKARACL